MKRTQLLALTILIGVSAHAADHVLLVGGLGGEERYEKSFAKTLDTVGNLLTNRYEYEADKLTVLKDDATVESIGAAIAQVGEHASPEDTFLLLLLGHGQSDYQEAKFNVKGPDLAPAALKTLLDALPMKDQRVLLLFACSGTFSEVLAAPSRVILASTDGPRQIYAAVAPRYLVEALESDYADADYDGAISFLELFDFLTEEVEGHYKAIGAIQLENPSLEDNGDGRVTTRVEGMDAGDGDVAASTRFVPAPSVSAEDG